MLVKFGNIVFGIMQSYDNSSLLYDKGSFLHTIAKIDKSNAIPSIQGIAMNANKSNKNSGGFNITRNPDTGKLTITYRFKIIMRFEATDNDYENYLE